MIADNALEINKFIQVHVTKYRVELYTKLCQVLNKCLPPKNVITVLFQQFYKDINEIKEFIPFLNFIAVLLDFISKTYDGYAKNQFLNNILIKFTEFFSIIDLSKATNDGSEIFNKLEEFMEKIIEGCKDINEILTLEPFLQFVSYLPSEMRNNVCKKFLNLFAESNVKISDPICVHSLLSIVKNVNDNYAINMAPEEKKNISELVKKFLANVCNHCQYDLK